MSVRKVLAMVALAGGLSGVGLIVADTGLVVGSTSDAGVPSACAGEWLCSNVHSAIQVPLPPNLTTTSAGSTPSAV